MSRGPGRRREADAVRGLEAPAGTGGAPYPLASCPSSWGLEAVSFSPPAPPMIALVQRVSSASVSVDGEVVGEVGRGVLVLLGVLDGDTEAEGDWLADKVARLRIFPDEAGKMNRSLQDVGGGALVVSQFTLAGDARKGTRPSYVRAARPDVAEPLYEAFAAALGGHLGGPVARGVFGARMEVALVNDGPVTLWIEREPRA